MSGSMSKTVSPPPVVGVRQKNGDVKYYGISCTLEQVCYQDPCWPNGDIGCDNPPPSDTIPVYVIPHYADNPYMVSCVSSNDQVKLNSVAFDILKWLRTMQYTGWTYENSAGAAQLNISYSDGSKYVFSYSSILGPGEDRNPSSVWVPEEVILGPDAWGYRADFIGVNYGPQNHPHYCNV